MMARLLSHGACNCGIIHVLITADKEGGLMNMVYQARMFTRANTIGFLFLLLLSSHEVLVVARNIHAHSQRNSHNTVLNDLSVKVRQRKVLGDMLRQLHTVLGDNSDTADTFFIEEAEKSVIRENFLNRPDRRSKMQGEVKELAGLYRMLQDSFDFPSSPMRSEIETLKIAD